MGMRINKYIKECGVASRREADRFVEEGRVRINGINALPGSLVTEGDEVTLDGKSIRPVTEKHIVAFYKPVGVTCTKKDEHAEVIINDIFSYPFPLTYAGRLDKDSEGLLLLTDDGKLIDAMMRERSGHEKEYEVTFSKEITKAFLESFSRGVYLKELDRETRPCKFRITGKKTADIILTQGLNRQIRRCGHELGNDVTKIKRIRVVNITLDDLKPGEFRELSQEEKNTLYETVMHK